jgi:hypothetical protein
MTVTLIATEPEPPRPQPRHRRRWRRYAAVAVVLAMIYPVVTYVQALTYPSDAGAGVRTVNWLRDDMGLGGAVNAVENWWYTINTPSAGPPAADAAYGSVLAGAAWFNQDLTTGSQLAGTKEPLRNPGAPGQVPDSLRGRLLATFNAGFKTIDAHGGSYLDGRLLVPLREGAASVVIHRDGRISVDQWGRDIRMSSDIVSAQQSLDLIVDNGKVVPGLDVNRDARWGSARSQLQRLPVPQRAAAQAPAGDGEPAGPLPQHGPAFLLRHHDPLEHHPGEALRTAIVAALALLLTGCAGQNAAPPPDPTAPEQNAAGDIPDNQVFIPYAGSGFTVNVPEGWAHTAEGGPVVFTDKFNSVRIETTLLPQAPTVDSVTQNELPHLPGGKVSTVHRTAGNAILISYEDKSAPDPVTGKRVVESVQRYEFWRNGFEVILTLSGAKGADNVDPWRTVTDSLRWT